MQGSIDWFLTCKLQAAIGPKLRLRMFIRPWIPALVTPTPLYSVCSNNFLIKNEDFETSGLTSGKIPANKIPKPNLTLLFCLIYE